MNLHDFDDIRPFAKGEMKQAFESLLNDRRFFHIIKGFLPWLPSGMIKGFLRLCFKGINEPQDFQERFMQPIVWYTLKKYTTGWSANFDPSLDRKGSYTFISNHRDIVLDSAYLDYMLHMNKFRRTVEIAIGNNLLVYPWIETLVKMNKSFVVNRGLTPKEMLRSSTHMSQYMHFAINEKKENIWIAQREGRAKDSNDRTQESVLKMLNIGGPAQGRTTADIIRNLKDMNLVPLTISYEYDPCDYLKAKEFQCKRDIPGWKKSKQDDLDNMKTGIFGTKGHVHFEAAACINDWLDSLDAEAIAPTDIYKMVAEHIDHIIHSNYRLYTVNEDALAGRTNEYIESRIRMVDIENPDTDFLRQTITTMYANPARNKQCTL